MLLIDLELQLYMNFISYNKICDIVRKLVNFFITDHSSFVVLRLEKHFRIGLISV